MTVNQTPIFYINLANRTDRREFIEGQLARLGLVGERIEAITVDLVPKELEQMHAKARLPYWCATGDLACGLSHVAAWKLILERGYDSAIVLEDDAVLTPSFADFAVPGLLQRLGADMIKLETWRKPVHLGPLRRTIGSTEVRELISTQLGGAAYLTGRAAIERSLASPVLNRLTVDQFLFGRGGPHLIRSVVLQASPSPVIQLDRLDKDHHVAQSSITVNRLAARAAVKRVYDHWAVARINVDHAARLLRLILRDPAVLFSKRRRVPFAGDAVGLPMEAPMAPAPAE